MTLLYQQWQLEASFVHVVAASKQNTSKMTSKLVLSLRRNSTITEHNRCLSRVWVYGYTVTTTETKIAPGYQADTIPGSEFNGESKNGIPGVWLLGVWALEALKVTKCPSRGDFRFSRGGTIYISLLCCGRSAPRPFKSSKLTDYLNIENWPKTKIQEMLIVLNDLTIKSVPHLSDMVGIWRT